MKVEDMSLTQLGDIFPIVLKEYQEEWINIACEEEMLLRYILGDDVAAITHIGSTSLPGLVLSLPLTSCWR